MRSKLLASHVTKLDRDRSGAWRRVRLSDQIATLSGRIDIKHGWTAESFQDELEQHTGFRLEPAVEEEPPEDVYRDHVGIHQQKQPDYCYVGAAGGSGPSKCGLLPIWPTDSLTGELCTTNMQNLLIVNVPHRLASELNAVGLPAAGSPVWPGAIACSGSEFCKLAITQTKSFSRWLVEELEERLPGFEQHLKLHVTGCPNSCGQHSQQSSV